MLNPPFFPSWIAGAAVAWVRHGDAEVLLGGLEVGRRGNLQTGAENYGKTMGKWRFNGDMVVLMGFLYGIYMD